MRASKACEAWLPRRANGERCWRVRRRSRPLPNPRSPGLHTWRCLTRHCVSSGSVQTDRIAASDKGRISTSMLALAALGTPKTGVVGFAALLSMHTLGASVAGGRALAAVHFRPKTCWNRPIPRCTAIADGGGRGMNGALEGQSALTPHTSATDKLVLPDHPCMTFRLATGFAGGRIFTTGTFRLRKVDVSNVRTLGMLVETLVE